MRVEDRRGADVDADALAAAIAELGEDATERTTAVALAYVHEDEVTAAWHHSVMALLGHDLAGEGRLLRGGWIAMRCGTDGLPQARNQAVQEFLAGGRADWLLWLDTDAGFEPDLLERLFAAADPVERPIVGALAFSYREERSDGMGGHRCRPTPTIFDWLKLDSGEMGFVVRWGYAPDTLVRCAGTGSHAILIHRSVFEQVAERYGPTWYDRIPNTSTGQLVSEDLSFCMRAGTLRIPVHVHTGARSSHQKTTWVGEGDYLATVEPPPATVPTAVLVPALRSSNAARFMASLRASTGVATAYAVWADGEEDQAAAWAGAGAELLYAAGARTFAERMNAGYAKTVQPFVFIVGDDVHFRAGWLDHAQAVAEQQNLDVVGTNDLGNPRVIAGNHATHLLIRRSYVDDVGASWDGPGIVCHEGYRHWYVDDEIVAAAKQRGVWGMAIDSKVEHLHPLWGKGVDDAVYELGASHADADRATFDARWEAHRAS